MKRLVFIDWLSVLLVTLASFIVSCTDKYVSEDVSSSSTLETRGTNIGLNKYYPIVPVMEEWKSFKTGDEMWDACQLPKGMLESLTTSELLEACMQFPLAYDYLLVNDERNAIRFEFEKFNGLGSLLQREDAVSTLVNYYEAIPFDIDSRIADGVFRFTPFTVSYLELIIADDAVLQKATPQELKQIQKAAFRKYKDKLVYSGDLGSDNLKRTIYLWAKIRMLSGDKTQIISKFVEDYLNVTLDDILEVSQLMTE